MDDANRIEDVREIRKFHFKANVVFDADNLDHAIELLAGHFRFLTGDNIFHGLEFVGEMTLEGPEK